MYFTAMMLGGGGKWFGFCLFVLQMTGHDLILRVVFLFFVN